MVFQVTLACLSDLLGLARNLEVQAREARGGLEKALELPGRGHPSADLLREDPRDRGEEVRLLCREEGALVLVGHDSQGQGGGEGGASGLRDALEAGVEDHRQAAARFARWVGRERAQLREDAVLEEEGAQFRHGRGQVDGVVLDWVRGGVVDPVGKTRRTSRGAQEEVGYLRVQVQDVLRFLGKGERLFRCVCRPLARGLEAPRKRASAW